MAMAEGNALGKGPVIFHLFDSGIELIRRKAAGESCVCITHSLPLPQRQARTHAPTDVSVRPHI